MSSTWTFNQSVYWSHTTCVNTTVTEAEPSNISTTEESIRKRKLSWNLSTITLPGTASSSPCGMSISLDTLLPLGDGRFQARYWEPVQSGLASNTTDCLSTGLLGVLVDLKMTGSMLDSNITAFACQPVYRHAIANISFTGNLPPTIEPFPSTISNLAVKDFDMAGFQSMKSSAYAATRLSGERSISIPGATEAQYQRHSPHATFGSGRRIVLGRVTDQ
ncbi:hypothetical protein BJX99DRAFT_263272 [Aspergillus californicus]